MPRLVPEALYSNELLEQHRIRGRRHVDNRTESEAAHDVVSPETAWRRVYARITRIDPLGLKSHALATEVESNR
jgi:hypothetical protein